MLKFYRQKITFPLWESIVAFYCLKACDGKFVSLVVNASAKIVETNENFICATLDWWPPEKCDYGRCNCVDTSLPTLVSISFSIDFFLNKLLHKISSSHFLKLPILHNFIFYKRTIYIT